MYLGVALLLGCANTAIQLTFDQGELLTIDMKQTTDWRRADVCIAHEAETGVTEVLVGHLAISERLSDTAALLGLAAGAAAGGAAGGAPGAVGGAAVGGVVGKAAGIGLEALEESAHDRPEGYNMRCWEAE